MLSVSESLSSDSSGATESWADESLHKFATILTFDGTTRLYLVMALLSLVPILISGADLSIKARFGSDPPPSAPSVPVLSGSVELEGLVTVKKYEIFFCPFPSYPV